MLYAPNGKNLALPIVMHLPLLGRFVGRMLLRPTLTDKNGAFFPLSRLFLFGLTGYHLGGSLERGVPFGSELADQGFAQETVGWYAQPFA